MISRLDDVDAPVIFCLTYAAINYVTAIVSCAGRLIIVAISSRGKHGTINKMTIRFALARSFWSVQCLSRRVSHGRLAAGGRSFRCAIGRGGLRVRKREADGASPVGEWRALRVLYRGDKVGRPTTSLPVSAIRRRDGWCDAPADRNYNGPVTLPYPASAEALWRDDDVYDLIVILDHNTRPRLRGAGSAIFIHVAREGYLPTEGCIALSLRDLRIVLRMVPRRFSIDFGGTHRATRKRNGPTLRPGHR